MAWALQFDGVNDRATATTVPSIPNGFVFKARVRLNSAPVGNFNTYISIGPSNEEASFGFTQSGVFRFVLRNTSINTTQAWNIGQWYELEISQPSGGGFRVIDAKIDGLVVGSQNKPSPDLTGAGFVFGESSSQVSANIDIEWVEYTELASGAGNAYWDATSSSHAAGTPILTDTIGGNDATGVNMPTNGSAWINLGGGGISVTGDTAAFDFTALAGTVDLAGEILVTGSTASFDYTAINGGVEFTGEISVTGETASFDYIALPGTIDLTGEIIVTGSTASFDYTGENGVIELGAVINVVGQTANFDVNGVNAEVLLTGEITIVGDTATFDYIAKSGIVVIGEGQKIGTVTAGFANSTIGVQYKQNTITVNFGE